MENSQSSYSLSHYIVEWKKRKIDHLLLIDGPSLSFYTISDIQAEDSKYLGIYLDRRLTRKKYG